MDIKLRGDFIIYCYSFQEFDMYKKRDIEEIESIIDSIPHNKGFIRNDILFEGTFDYLVENITFLIEKVVIFKASRKNDKASLSEFIIFAFTI